MYAPRRSAVEELLQGAHFDGSFKQPAKDRGCSIDSATERARRDLFGVWHGLHADSDEPKAV